MTAPRMARPTVRFVDEYCESYRDLFVEVRSFEAFKHLHAGMISEAKRKSLPTIAKVAGLPNAQSLQQFLVNSPWQARDLRQRRIELILALVAGRKLVLVIDETGDRKKGHVTDYVKRQYIGNLGKVENGIVSVDAYGVLDNITFPLTFEIYKPKERLKAGECHRTKPAIAAAMVQDLCQLGFKFELVLADSAYGESGSSFVRTLHQLELPYVLAIRSNHAVLLPKEQRVRTNRWREYDRQFSDGKRETRFIREIVYGKRRAQRYWQLTTDRDVLPSASTWMVMTWVKGLSYKQVGDLYGLRNWVEYGFKQSKNELGWADFRVTDYTSIEKWWEIVMSAYLMVTLHTPPMRPKGTIPPEQDDSGVVLSFTHHSAWGAGNGWKNWLNNLRLILLPWVSSNLLKPWLKIFPIPKLEQGFQTLTGLMNLFPGASITNPQKLSSA
ncbi:IS701 family transposase [Nodosilinea sp. E11]|uniref:IS701 family transposase n=1 Tax=Nodosilinea sp. E11 TaxID=3037479 RepID=UPI002934CE11|nr:IS701 family transposase [Nodosilinea sp. E11]WOD37201.1 IS701 family transposase [Nodosilinea sp. E11]WOD37234.1 IS701 family transposase [Nodosilinea sp. E11]WOD37518.1 IS701 family transposase [Nodosilinea sp. E11]